MCVRLFVCEPACTVPVFGGAVFACVACVVSVLLRACVRVCVRQHSSFKALGARAGYSVLHVGILLALVLSNGAWGAVQRSSDSSSTPPAVAAFPHCTPLLVLSVV
jgi:hypothetical protein